MKLNPYISALLASLYIGLVVLFIHYISSIRHDTPDTLLDGMGFISLVVFSVAIMGFLFFYQPAVMLLENKRADAISHFLKTLAVFGVITLALLTFITLQ